MNGCLSKPLDPKKLFGILQDIVGSSKLHKVTFRQENAEPCQTERSPYTLPDELPGINMREGLIRISGKVPQYLKMLKIFKEKQINSIEGIRSAILQDDITTAIRIAHTLKGTAASIGANEVSMVARELQIALENNEESDEIINLLLGDLELKLKIVERSLAELGDSI